MRYRRDSRVNLVHRALRLPYESPNDRQDHCPVVYTFSRGGVRRLFRDFSSVEGHSDYPFTYGFGPLTTRLPLGVRRRLGRAIGWDLMITAQRGGRPARPVGPPPPRPARPARSRVWSA